MLSRHSPIQSFIFISSYSLKIMLEGVTFPWTMPFWWRNCKHSSRGRKVFMISVS